MSWPIHAWYRQAVCRLQLSPADFWAMPVTEWLRLIDPTDHHIDRAALKQLMETFPDE